VVDGQHRQVDRHEIVVATETELDDRAHVAGGGDAFGDCHIENWGVGERVRTCGFSGFLDAGTPTAAHSFEVPPGTQLLRVAFNGIATSNGTLDTNYYLRAGTPPTQLVHDCAADGTGTLGYCEFENPTPGVWHVLAEETLYQGEYQVSVSTFAKAGMNSTAVPAMGPRARVALLGLLLVSALGLGFRHSRSRGGFKQR